MAITLEKQEILALYRFAWGNGKHWKSALNRYWLGDSSGNYLHTPEYFHPDDEPFLRAVRNKCGPSWLAKFRLPDGFGWKPEFPDEIRQLVREIG